MHYILCKFTGRNLFHTIESVHFPACIVQYAGRFSAAGGDAIECWFAMHLIWLHLRFSSCAQTCIQNPHRFMYFQVVLNWFPLLVIIFSTYLASWWPSYGPYATQCVLSASLRAYLRQPIKLPLWNERVVGEFGSSSLTRDNTSIHCCTIARTQYNLSNHLTHSLR